ncbi:hypothetical protein GQX74_005807 [Glossina fuscipes]|nr:hypothetical protein GQX74_005807 [Glossina fuscipes]
MSRILSMKFTKIVSVTAKELSVLQLRPWSSRLDVLFSNAHKRTCENLHTGQPHHSLIFLPSHNEEYFSWFQKCYAPLNVILSMTTST